MKFPENFTITAKDVKYEVLNELASRSIRDVYSGRSVGKFFSVVEHCGATVEVIVDDNLVPKIVFNTNDNDIRVDIITTELTDKQGFGFDVTVNNAGLSTNLSNYGDAAAEVFYHWVEIAEIAREIAFTEVSFEEDDIYYKYPTK